MLESSLSRAWTLSGCQGHHCQVCLTKKFFYKTFFQASWLCLDVKSHHCQGPERGVWMSGSSLSRAWTWCLYVRVITVKSLNVVSGCQGHHCQGPKHCVWISGSSLFVKKTGYTSLYSRASSMCKDFVMIHVWSRAWTWYLYCQVNQCKLAWTLSSHYWQGPERCVKKSGSSMSIAWAWCTGCQLSSLSKTWTLFLDLFRVITEKNLNVRDLDFRVQGCHWFSGSVLQSLAMPKDFGTHDLLMNQFIKLIGNN